MLSVVKEKCNALSRFVLFSESADVATIPQLSFLRVELSRVRPGMSDYIIRVSTPNYKGVERSNTVISIRGSRSLTKQDELQKLATLISNEMTKREDATHNWEECDIDHLAKLIQPCIKFFSQFTNAGTLRFTTEALK